MRFRQFDVLYAAFVFGNCAASVDSLYKVTFKSVIISFVCACVRVSMQNSQTKYCMLTRGGNIKIMVSGARGTTVTDA